MLRVPLSNPALRRTLRPLYAQHQATPQAGFLDPTWNKSKDIYPGSVMYRKQGEVYTLYVGGVGTKPYGLSALFVAPVLGVDELTDTASNLFTVWVGNADAQFEILAPAFDAGGDWSVPTDGSIKLLTGNASGLLTPTGAVAGNAIAELIDATPPTKIVVRPARPV